MLIIFFRDICAEWFGGQRVGAGGVCPCATAAADDFVFAEAAFAFQFFGVSECGELLTGLINLFQGFFENAAAVYREVAAREDSAFVVYEENAAACETAARGEIGVRRVCGRGGDFAF